LALFRQARARGAFFDVPSMRALYGPALGRVPDFESTMMDLAFPAKPFGPPPGWVDDQTALDAREQKVPPGDR
jgi:hypothetical protein